MWFVFGSSSGVQDLGVVAEQCPLCKRVAPCSLVGRYEGIHVYFITLVGSLTGSVCTCGLCGGQFAGELWRYKDPVPATEACCIPIEELVRRTNPQLKDRVERARWLEQHQTDPQFTKTLQSVEQLRYGDLRKGFMDELTRWDQVDDIQRAAFLTKAAKLAHSLRFANTIARELPHTSGCLVALLVCVLIWSVFLFVPAVRNLLWGGLTIFAGLCAAGWVWQTLLARRVRSWTKEVLVPKGKEAGLDFQSFLTVLGDLPPPGPHTDDALRHLKEHEKVIRGELMALGEMTDA